MDKKSKILLTVFVLTLLISIGVTFYRTVVLKDFEIIEVSEDLVETNEASEESDSLESIPTMGGELEITPIDDESTTEPVEPVVLE